MAGGIVASYILHALLPGTSDINLELSASCSVVQGLFIETFATTTLILAVLMLGVGEFSTGPPVALGPNNQRNTWSRLTLLWDSGLLSPRLCFLPCHILGQESSESSASIRPCAKLTSSVARAFGTAIIEGFQPYHWIYCEWLETLPDTFIQLGMPYSRTGLGPTIGAVFASAFYEFLKFIQYWYVTTFSLD